MANKKLKRYKVGVNSETLKISLVSEPAIGVDYVALSKQDEAEIKLSSDERHICYGPAIIPNRDIYRNNGEQEFYINFTEESIVKMSQEFMKEYRQHEVNLQHEDDVDEVFVCESWVVEDPYRDKANAIGFNVPKGTWMLGMKVNNIETWDRIKAGELKGFSVESMVSLEEFNNHTNLENMEIETNEMFWTKLKNLMSDIITKVSLKKEDVDTEDSEATKVEHLEEETPTAEEPNEATVTPSEPQNEEGQTPTKEEENKAIVDETVEEKKEEPKDNHIEELVNNLKAEIEALKELNKDLTNKVKDLGRAPSAKPKNVNATPKKEDTFAQWRAFAAKIDY